MVDARRRCATLARLGVVASVQPMFDALWGGTDGMYAQRARRPSAQGHEPVRLAGPGRRRPGVRLGLAGHRRSTRGRRSGRPPGTTTESERITVRAAFDAHTRGGWRAAGATTAACSRPVRRRRRGLGRTRRLSCRPRTPGRRLVDRPRAGVPVLPDLSPTPTCRPACSRCAGGPLSDEPHAPVTTLDTDARHRHDAGAQDRGKLDLDPVTVRKARAPGPPGRAARSSTWPGSTPPSRWSGRRCGWPGSPARTPTASRG